MRLGGARASACRDISDDSFLQRLEGSTAPDGRGRKRPVTKPTCGDADLRRCRPAAKPACGEAGTREAGHGDVGHDDSRHTRSRPRRQADTRSRPRRCGPRR